MADFVAVLKKTLDGLGETSPQMREKVYVKARATIAAKLASLNPAPPAAVAERQKRALEDAILAVENEFAALAAVEDSLFGDYDDDFGAADNVNARVGDRENGSTETADLGPEALADEQDRRLDYEGPAFGASIDRAPRRRSLRGLIMFLLALLILGAGTYAVWLNKEEFSTMIGFTGTDAVAEKPKRPARKKTSTKKPAEPAATAEATEPATEVAAVAPEPSPAQVEPTPAPAAAPPAEEPPKFTQRLNADGSEIDAGRAGGALSVGEGTSVASATLPAIAAAEAAPAPAPADTLVAQAPAVEPPVAEPPAAETPVVAPPAVEAPAPETPAAAEPAAGDPTVAAAPATETAAAPATVPVGQKAIFYEERTNVAEGSAETGGIVWSLISESPGGDRPPEPVIRAEATIPGKDLQLRMTIKRNGDETLPASHIVELIFLTPDGFDGGGIDNVLRIALKTSEEEAGSPLIGIPAKIADGFFLFALNDTKPEVDANTALLGDRSWIDVPIVYKSGRRALFTMEKGIPGEKVFQEALKAWGASSSG